MVEKDQWVPQSPTDADGYSGREEARVMAQMLVENPQECKELLSAPIAGLIGRIGADGGAFFVGNDKSFAAGETGILYLRINYVCRKRYVNKLIGMCPVLSGGSLSVRVSVIPHQ